MAVPEKLIDTSLVSVIVPCYNHAQYLPEALDSVLAQTYSNWECIIVNDGSTDNTEMVASGYCKKDSRIKYVAKSNGGLSSARNYGIKHSSGKYILPLDADDKISDFYLEKAVALLDELQDLNVVYGKVQLFGTTNEEWEQPPFDFKTLLVENFLYCTSLFRKGDYDKTNGYDETMKDGLEDWDFWISLLKNNGKAHQLPFVCFYYRKKEVSMFNDLVQNKKKLFNAYLKVYNNQIDSYHKYFENPITLIQENIKLERIVKAYQQSRTYKMGLKLQRLKDLFSKKNAVKK